MVSTRQSSNSSTNTDVSSLVEINKPYEAGALVPSKKNQQHSGLSASAGTATEESNSYIGLMDLPVEIIQKILGYLNYNNVAHLRPVSINVQKF